MVAAATPIEPLLLTAEQAAKALSVSQSTLTRLTKGGDLPCVRFFRTLRYSPADLAAWIERRRVAEQAGQRLPGA